MAQYDPDIIVEFADRLYSRAEWVVLRDTLVGTASGFLIGLGLHSALQLVPKLRIGLAVAVGVLGLIVGWISGNDRAFALRLQAQLALCQLETELNTRRPE